MNFTTLAEQLVRFNEDRHYFRHSNVSLLEQAILQLIGGYATDLAATSLRHDPLLKLLLDKAQLAAQPTLSHFWRPL